MTILDKEIKSLNSELEKLNQRLGVSMFAKRHTILHHEYIHIEVEGNEIPLFITTSYAEALKFIKGLPE